MQGGGVPADAVANLQDAGSRGGRAGRRRCVAPLGLCRREVSVIRQLRRPAAIRCPRLAPDHPRLARDQLQPCHLPPRHHGERGADRGPGCATGARRDPRASPHADGGERHLRLAAGSAPLPRAAKRRPCASRSDPSDRISRTVPRQKRRARNVTALQPRRDEDRRAACAASVIPRRSTGRVITRSCRSSSSTYDNGYRSSSSCRWPRFSRCPDRHRKPRGSTGW